MASLGKAFIEIHADLKEFPAETKTKLKAALEEGARSMDLKPIEEKVSEAGTRAADGMERRLRDRLKAKAGEFAKRGTEIGDKIMSGMLSAVTSKAALMTVLIGAAVLGAGQLIGPVLALAAAIPAAMGIAVASVAVLATAFHGVGDAIKAAFGDDQQALNQAMAKLAPAAREVVAEFASFRPQLHALQQDIQQTFFVQLEGSVKRLMSTLLPTLRAGLHQVSADLGQMGRGVLDALSSPSGKEGIASMLLSAHQAIKPLIPAVKQLVGAFVTLGAAAGPFVAELAKGFASLLTVFAEFISKAASDGSLADFFQSALDTMRLLKEPLKAVMTILGALFDAVANGGPDILSVIGQLSTEIAKLFASPQGQELIRAIGEIVVALAGILIALTPILPPLAALIASVGVDLANALVKATPFIKEMADKLAGLIGFLKDNKGAVEGLTIALGAGYAAVKLYAVGVAISALIDKWKKATVGMTIAQWSLNSAMLANPIGLIIVGIALIIAGIVLLIVYWDDVKKAGAAAWRWIEDAAKSVWNWLKGVGSSIGDWFGKVLHWFEELPGKIGDFLASLPGKLYDLLLAALSYAGEAVAWGIGLWLWTIVRLPGLIWDGLKSLGSTLWDLLTSAWNWAKDAFSKGVDAVVDFAVKLPGRIGDFLTSLPGVLSHAFRTAWQWAKDETAKAGDWIIDFARKLPGRLGNFFGSVGHDIVAGLKSGINAAIRGFNKGVDDVGSKLHIGLPHIPMLAKGAIIDSPTLAVVGERGREVVMPLNDPARANELAAKSGLLGILKQTSPVPLIHFTAYLGTGHVLEVMKTVVEQVVGGQASDLANGVRTA